MENGGVMTGELYEDIAPITVENFEKLARRFKRSDLPCVIRDS